MTHAYDLAELGIEYAQSNGASYAEARVLDGQVRSFVLQNGNLVSGFSSPMCGIGFRVLVNGGLSFCSVNQLVKKNIESTLATGIKMARVSNPKDKIEFGAPVANEAKWKVPVKENWADIDNETMIGLLKAMDKTAEENGISTRMFLFEAHQYKKYIVTSEGTRIDGDISTIRVLQSLSAKGDEGTEQRTRLTASQSGWECTKAWLSDFEQQYLALSKVANEPKRHLKSGETVDFLAGPEIAGIIAHENCGHPSEGDRIMGREGAQAGESHWRDLELGKSQVGSSHVNIYDDPTIPGSAGYYLYDDEGVKARNRVLIKNGIINEPLLNREFGAKFGLNSNGAARATAYNREPIIRMANTFFSPGEFTFEELLEDIKKGVYMKTFTEWNIDDRRYQSKYVGQECYLIENGEITEKIVQRPVLETTTVGLFSSIDGVSKKLDMDTSAICGKSEPMQGAPVRCGGGHLRLRNIELG
ncbi:MAG: TldD/PmbA family protein [Candidatus Hodarchaeales archaeon]|jgi:TldD protein